MAWSRFQFIYGFLARLIAPLKTLIETEPSTAYSFKMNNEKRVSTVREFLAYWLKQSFMLSPPKESQTRHVGCN
jgi:hypothetical protein